MEFNFCNKRKIAVKLTMHQNLAVSKALSDPCMSRQSHLSSAMDHLLCHEEME